ncbi:heme NO-binding domain-containing protein [Roseateles sp. BYS87W]|uniref:Heme NO-binding domain-containing protein n=1 Tax=Pelomonas baiyunensis TaxID=3299026 RepID=A0ABW7GZ03_9BURK
MYGLVNRAIEQLVVSLKGDSAWERVCQRAGWPDGGFVAMQTYDDAVTYRLVGAVSEELGLPPDAVLRAFGEYWILYTAEEGYGSMLTMCGSDLLSFLHGMNQMHARIEASLPEIRPPSFEVHELDAQTFALVYESTREGLAPMVEGLITGLAKRFGQRVDIRLTAPRDASTPHDRFLVQILA